MGDNIFVGLLLIVLTWRSSGVILHSCHLKLVFYVNEILCWSFMCCMCYVCVVFVLTTCTSMLLLSFHVPYGELLTSVEEVGESCFFCYRFLVIWGIFYRGVSFSSFGLGLHSLFVALTDPTI